MRIIKKNLDFKMVLDGEAVNSLEELRRHPSTELLPMLRDGRLGRWLRTHDGAEQAEKLDALALTEDAAVDLAAICAVLGMDVDIDDIRACMAEAGAKQTAPVAEGRAEPTASSMPVESLEDSISPEEAEDILLDARSMLKIILDSAEKNKHHKWRIVKEKFTESKSDNICIARDMDRFVAKSLYKERIIFLENINHIDITNYKNSILIIKNAKNVIMGCHHGGIGVVHAQNVYFNGETWGAGNSNLIVFAENIFMGSKIYCKSDSIDGIKYDDRFIVLVARNKLVHPFDHDGDEAINFDMSSNDIEIEIRKQKHNFGIYRHASNMFYNHSETNACDSKFFICAHQGGSRYFGAYNKFPSCLAGRMYDTLLKGYENWLASVGIFDTASE